MPKQAQEKILEGYPMEELIRLKWSEVEKQSRYAAGLDVLEMFKQEKEPQQRHEQGSLSFEDEAEQYYRRLKEEMWKRQEMCAFEDAWREAMAGRLDSKITGQKRRASATGDTVQRNIEHGKV